ncbi:unnamed protein product [Schistosoma mattheei]|uniref:URB1 N-terminal domain-containing protein n=1 Tax=Schistosoma mattheei TaxID=31246 RepID=A0A3P7XR65_9TREM|nr:unnamed protein product [Schistosoma mattheei]
MVNFVESINNEDVDELVVDVVAGGNVVQILKFLDSGQDRKAGEVAENSSVSKTQRVRVFNRHCLQKLTSLYMWRGEGKTVDEVLRKDNAEVNEHELVSIRDTVHKLLTHLFTSSRFGLVFSNKFDVNVQYNRLILLCLTSAQMEDAYTDPLRTELVVVALCKCPDLFLHYLDHLAPSLYPRDSPSWFCLIEFVFHVSPSYYHPG